jgi:hypothetical protein
MKYLVLFLITCFTARAQTFGGIYTTGFYNSKDFQKENDKAISKGQTKKEIASSSKAIHGDTVSYVVQHNVDPFTMKAVFNVKDTILNENMCGWQEYVFDCTPCSEKHLDEFIRIYKFREKSGNVYMSEYFTRTEMTVIYTSGDKRCMTVTFRYIDMPKKQYKALYKSLKKKAGT